MDILAVLVVVALGSSAATTRYDMCPSSLPTRQSAVAVPAGWAAHVSDRESHLTGAGFSRGHPERLMILAPHESRSGYNRFIFGGSDEIWISCGYNGTQVSLDRAIGHPSSCEVMRLPATTQVSCSYPVDDSGAPNADRTDNQLP